MKVPPHWSIGALALLAASSSAMATPSSAAIANACAIHAPEAASRSGLSANVILRVMMAESGGNPRARSPKGAGGCMQIMPATWTYLSSRYALGPDRFNPRMNMIGGALYLAELAARYGFPGAYAAYNAGPGRYERYAAGTAVLPAETIAYTARIGRTAVVPNATRMEPRWQEASLFLPRNAPPAAKAVVPRAETGDAGRPPNLLFPLGARDGLASSETGGR